MTAPTDLAVLDASIVIAAQNPAEPLHDRALSLLDEAAGLPWILHPLTHTELLVLPARAGGADAVARYQGLLTELGIEAAEPDGPADLHRREARVELAELRARTGLKLPDAAVLHLAVGTGALLLTLDERLARAARDEGVEVLGF